MSTYSLELLETRTDHLEALFQIQTDKEANFVAAFTSKNPSDKSAYMEKWTKILSNPIIHNRTIIVDSIIAGSVAKYVMDNEAEITYWIDKKFWGKGIATTALKQFLEIEQTRPIFGRVAFDNHGSQRVMEKSGFKRIGTDVGFAEARQKEIQEYIYKLT